MKSNEIKKGIAIAVIIITIFVSGNLVGSLTASPTETTQKQTQSTTQLVVAQTTQAQTVSQTQPTTATQVIESTNSADTTTQVQPQTQSTEQIINLFNTATKNAKTSASQITQEYKNVTINPEKLIMPSAIKSVCESAMNNFVKGEREPQVYATKEEIVENFPVYASENGSSVTQTDITNATCIDKGDTYSVELIFADCTNPPANEGTNSAFPTLKVEGMANAPVIKNLVVEYTNCSIKAEIEKSTGNLISATYTMPFSMQFDVIMGFSFTVGAGIDYEYYYTLAY